MEQIDQEYILTPPPPRQPVYPSLPGKGVERWLGDRFGVRIFSWSICLM